MATSELVAKYPSLPAGEANSSPFPRLNASTTSVSGHPFMLQTLVMERGSAAIVFLAKPKISGFRPRALNMKMRAPARTCGFTEANRGESKLAKLALYRCSKLATRQAVLNDPPEPIARRGELPERLTCFERSATSASNAPR